MVILRHWIDAIDAAKQDLHSMITENNYTPLWTLLLTISISKWDVQNQKESCDVEIDPFINFDFEALP